MMDLYNDTCFECSKMITKKYSTSFSLGIKAFDRSLHYPIYAIYGFVRYADEIVDTFHQHNKSKLIKRFRDDTFEAIETCISLNPVLQSFQLIVNKFNIDINHISAFLDSMAMDLDQKAYSSETYREYIYGSAEVVGLMCLKVFCADDEWLYQKLIPQARSLGAAFQKINFLRDIKSDFEDRGRTYFPDLDYKLFSQEEKRVIEADIEQDFADALDGIKQLPETCRQGVYVAYVYYLELFKKIRLCLVDEVKSQRIRISDKRKMLLLAQALLKNKLNTI